MRQATRLVNCSTVAIHRSGALDLFCASRHLCRMTKPRRPRPTEPSVARHQAGQAGKFAAREGKSMDTNPYDEQMDFTLWMSWNTGWRSAQVS